jgi:tetratricopeptide (TPR) repeat protein
VRSTLRDRAGTALNALLLAVALSACAPKAPAVVVPAGPTPGERLGAAGELMLAGCLDCLIEAYGEFLALRDDPELGTAATSGAIRSALLVSIREHELGLLDSGHLRSAHQMLAASALHAADLSPLAEIADAIVAGPSGPLRTATLESQTLSLVRLSRNLNEWAAQMRGRMPADRVASYLWLSLACGIYGSQVSQSADRAPVVGYAPTTTLVAFKEATACTRGRADVLQQILDAVPRFGELHYYLGLAALAGQPRPGAPGGTPDLELADREFRAAYEWRAHWPAVTLSIANTALTAEDFDRAFEFYGQTLSLVPGHADALLGRIRALTYLTRHREAIGAADELLATGGSLGEGRYWRALNEEQLNDHDRAWEDVELAERLVVNADVPKLAGIIAINRRDLVAARHRLEVAINRRPDCDTGYYLQIVLSETREWNEAARVAGDTGRCFDREEEELRGEIERFRAASDMPPERRARQIARRERQITANGRMRANAWFNAAAASFNVGRRDEARAFAEKVADDEQFGDRARQLIERLPR